MQYRSDARLNPSQMGSGGRRGGTIALGGGPVVIVLILALVFGFDPGALLGGTSAGPEPTESAYAECRTGADIEENRDCRFVAYTNSIQAFWATQLESYQETKTVTFAGQVAHRLWHRHFRRRTLLLPSRPDDLPRYRLLRPDARGPTRRGGR